MLRKEEEGNVSLSEQDTVLKESKQPRAASSLHPR